MTGRRGRPSARLPTAHIRVASYVHSASQQCWLSRIDFAHRWRVAGAQIASRLRRLPPIVQLNSVSRSCSTQYVTCRQCCCAIGDVEARKAVTTWTLGAGVPFQQVGNTWTSGDAIVSLSMSGDLNVFDKRVGDKPASILHVCALSLYTATSRLDVNIAP